MPPCAAGLLLETKQTRVILLVYSSEKAHAIFNRNMFGTCGKDRRIQCRRFFYSTHVVGKQDSLEQYRTVNPFEI